MKDIDVALKVRKEEEQNRYDQLSPQIIKDEVGHFYGFGFI